MRTQPIAAGLLVTASALASFSASAFTYNERASGDLSFFLSSDPTIHLLDAGENVLLGHSFWDYFGPNDNDSFAFLVPETFALTSVKLTITLTDGSGTLEHTDWLLTDASRPGAPPDMRFASSQARNQAMFGDILPKGHGIYGIHLVGFSGSLPSHTFKAFDYQFKLYVSPIPEATSMLMGCFGLATLATMKAGRRYRRGRHSCEGC